MSDLNPLLPNDKQKQCETTRDRSSLEMIRNSDAKRTSNNLREFRRIHLISIIILGMILIAAIGLSFYLTILLKDKTYFSNILFPFLVYAMNGFVCSIFNKEVVASKYNNTNAESLLFIHSTQVCQNNFKLISVQYVLSYCCYAFVITYDHFKSVDINTINIIFLFVWYLAYLFVFGFIVKCYLLYRNYNDLPVTDPSPEAYCKISVSSATEVNNPTIIEQKNTIKKLQKELDSIKEFQQDINSITTTTASSLDNNNNLIEEIKRLKDKLKKETETVGILSVEMKTKQALLQGQKSEYQQLSDVVHVKDVKIQQLFMEKESLERTLSATTDKYDDVSLLYQIKAQEVDIAKKEIDRLRQILYQK